MSSITREIIDEFYEQRKKLIEKLKEKDIFPIDQIANIKIEEGYKGTIVKVQLRGEVEKQQIDLTLGDE